MKDYSVLELAESIIARQAIQIEALHRTVADQAQRIKDLEETEPKDVNDV